MNTRGGTIGTATPRPTRHTRALPTTADHRSGRAPDRPKDPPGTGGALRSIYDDILPRTRGASTTPAIRGWGTTRQPWDRLVSPEAPTMDVEPTATGPAINRDDPGQANLAREDPLAQPDNARPRNTLRQRLSVGRAGEGGVKLPGLCSGHPTNAG